MVRTMRSPWNATKGDIHTAIGRALSDNEKAALATVVNVEGSGYRRPGAKMIIEAGGESQGAVTAGCLEGPVTDAAMATLADARPRTNTYDLTNDDTDAWGLGLGCNGVIDVFIEPIDASFAPVVNELDERQVLTVFTAVESSDPDVHVGDRTAVTNHGRQANDRAALPEDILAAAADRTQSLPNDESTCVTVETERGEVRVFIDRIEPSPDLLLFGGQEDINPVASLAKQAGFHVCVATARGARADSDQFPSADHVVASHPTELADQVRVPERTYAVIMSHNLVDDRLALGTLLDTTVPYIGVMGPRERFRELRKDLNLAGRDLDRIATPVGLDIGGDEPAAIGFSIVSEVLAVHNGRNGGRLVEQKGPIHNRFDM